MVDPALAEIDRYMTDIRAYFSNLEPEDPEPKRTCKILNLVRRTHQLLPVNTAAPAPNSGPDNPSEPDANAGSQDSESWDDPLPEIAARRERPMPVLEFEKIDIAGIGAFAENPLD